MFLYCLIFLLTDINYILIAFLIGISGNGLIFISIFWNALRNKAASHRLLNASLEYMLKMMFKVPTGFFVPPGLGGRVIFFVFVFVITRY